LQLGAPAQQNQSGAECHDSHKPIGVQSDEWQREEECSNSTRNQVGRRIVDSVRILQTLLVIDRDYRICPTAVYVVWVREQRNNAWREIREVLEGAIRRYDCHEKRKGRGTEQDRHNGEEETCPPSALRW